MSLDDLTRAIGRELSKEIAVEVLRVVRAELGESVKNEMRFAFTEREAAQRLNLSEQSLARERKAGAIDYSTYRGKIVYCPHHLYGFLLNNEIRNGKQPISLAELLTSAREA